MDGGGDIRFPPASALLHPDPPTGSTKGAADERADKASQQPLAPSKPAAKSKAAAKAKAAPAKASASSAQADGGTAKPKQSKSRNGCVTCKQKRLKCDETKPACRQCQKRQVECGGYKKDFKWRTFEETSFSSKSGLASKGKKSEMSPASSQEHRAPTGVPSSLDSPETSASQQSNSPEGNDGDMSTSQTSPAWSTVFPSPDPGSLPGLSKPVIRGHEVNSRHRDADGSKPSPAPTSYSQNAKGKASAIPRSHPETEDSNPDHQVPEDSPLDFNIGTQDGILIPVQPLAWTLVDGSDMSSRLGLSDPDFLNLLLNQPKLQANSPEMLLSGFSNQTAGLLSIRDGQHENPWRSAILPLVHESPALYHALAACTAFHSSKFKQGMKRTGVEHMRKGIQLLARDLRTMRPDLAITVTLVLAFAESWDVQVTTGIRHLQGAKQFILKALPFVHQVGPHHEFSRRIRFLCNTWVYMDVISRLTSLEADDSTFFDAAFEFDRDDQQPEIDPLMGCATTLFPWIGRVANLVRRVRQSSRNNMDFVTEAIALRKALNSWTPPPNIHEPEDTTCSVQHAISTAESYRWASQLYLHQAVPELYQDQSDPEVQSLPPAEFAKRTLVNLAMVPMTSRITIVQIYPLLAAGCEATSQTDRDWITSRWESMGRTMLIGNIDRCLEVVREVWYRRDQGDLMAAAQPQPYQDNLHGKETDDTIFSPTWGLSALERLSVTGDQDLQQLPPESVPTDPSFSGPTPETTHLHPYSAPGISRSWASQQSMASPASSDLLSSAALTPASSFATSSMDVPIRRPILHASKSRKPPAFEEIMPFDRTVRGSQHWIGVMRDWDWEILLG